jgi:hypothetical protein
MYTAKFDKREIMKTAHAFYRDGRHGDFAVCLSKAWDNAKAVKKLSEELGKELHTWFGWTLLGREVIHEQKCVAQVEMWATLKNKIRTIKSFFTFEQTCELGTQPIKIC